MTLWGMQLEFSKMAWFWPNNIFPVYSSNWSVYLNMPVSYNVRRFLKVLSESEILKFIIKVCERFSFLGFSSWIFNSVVNTITWGICQHIKLHSSLFFIYYSKSWQVINCQKNKNVMSRAIWYSCLGFNRVWR